MKQAGLVFVLAFWFQASPSWGDEAQPENPPVQQLPPIELAPPPHPTGNLFLPVVPVHTPPQHGRLSVWQLYGVDYAGRFRPRVIQSPHGAYYLYNFAPYPWTTTDSLRYMPYAVD